METIRQEASTCRAMLVVIGPDWVSARFPEGGRRLDDPNDIVRLEVLTALSRQTIVLPICVGGARLPAPAELPADLRLIFPFSD